MHEQLPTAIKWPSFKIFVGNIFLGKKENLKFDRKMSKTSSEISETTYAVQGEYP